MRVTYYPHDIHVELRRWPLITFPLHYIKNPNDKENTVKINEISLLVLFWY